MIYQNIVKVNEKIMRNRFKDIIDVDDPNYFINSDE